VHKPMSALASRPVKGLNWLVFIIFNPFVF